MNCMIDYDNCVEQRNTSPLLLPKVETGTEVIGVVKTPVDEAYLNCCVTSNTIVNKGILRKGIIRLPYQRANAQLGQRRSVLKVGDGYKGKYPLGTKTPTIVKYLASEPDRGKQAAVAKILRA